MGVKAMSNHSGRKGHLGEQEVNMARSLGLEASRAWQSAKSLDPVARCCDVRIQGRACQIKRSGSGFRQVYAALEGVELLFLRSDGREWLAVLPAQELFKLLPAIQNSPTTPKTDQPLRPLLCQTNTGRGVPSHLLLTCLLS